MNQLNLFESGRDLRDKGIQKSIAHADQVHEEWSERAYRFFLSFLQSWKGEFMTEDVRKASKDSLPEPPSNRAWGSITVRARKAGIIKSAGTGTVSNPTAHRCFATRWIKA